MMLRATASRAACLASSRLRCACSTSGRYATTSAFVNHGVLINTLPLRNSLRSMSILSRQRRREQLSQKDDEDNVWETSKVSDPNKLEAAEHEPVPEPAVVGEEKNEWKAVEDKLLKEARLKLPLMPMNIPDPEQIRQSGLSAWDLPMRLPPTQPENPKSLSVAIIGIPNAGKSTLLNQLLEAKLATVSHREQTTRDRILGIMTKDDTQIVIHDTPGLVERNRAKRLGISKLVATDGLMAAEETDAVMVVIDPTMNPPERQFDPLVGVPVKDLIVVINKIDMIKPPSLLLPLVDSLIKHAPVPNKNVLMVSALKKSGIDDLKALLMKKAQPRPWAFPAEHTTEMSPLKRISEQVREKYMPIGTEVPYVFKQHTRKIEFEPSGKLMVHHEIVVRKNSQKGLLIGKNGARISNVTTQVEQELEEIFKCPVSLLITIDVKKKQHAVGPP